QIKLDKIGQVKLSGWNVGESDWRLGSNISKASGKFTGPPIGLPGSQPLDLDLKDLTLRLISDEYAACPPDKAVVRRHAFADFELTIAKFPKTFAKANWDGPEIPISPDAIDQDLSGLADQISNDALRFITQFILNGVESAISIAGVVDID